MKIKTTVTLIALICLSVVGMNVFAADAKPNQDEAIVVGACMVKNFMDRKPPISQQQIEKCADSAGPAVPKCLGISQGEYDDTVKYCVKNLVTSKCVAGKMNVSLMQYATCGYETDAAACYTKLGSSAEKAKAFAEECEKAAQ